MDGNACLDSTDSYELQELRDSGTESEGDCSDIALYPGPFEKSEKRAWYPLFAHALN